MVEFVTPPATRSAGQSPTVPLLETRRSDLVMLCESKLRWAGIRYTTETLANAVRDAAALGSDELRVRVPSEQLEEAKRLLAAIDDEVF